MKKFLRFVVLAAAILLLTGMGSLQGPASPDKIPVPDKKYNAVVLDQTDFVAQCSEASIEGATFLEGKRGEGQHTLSFDHIQEVLFRLQADRLTGIAKLRDGGSSELTLDVNQKLYGRTRYGTFQIKLRDIKKLQIEAAPAK